MSSSLLVFRLVSWLVFARGKIQLLEQRREPVPARIDLGLGTAALAEVQVAAASGAQPTTVGPAHRGERELDADRVAHHLMRIQETLGIQGVFVRVLVREGGEELSQLDGE